MTSFLPRFAVVILAVCAFGCAPADTPERFPKRFPVTGAVTINGSPIAAGTIIFTSPEDVSRGSETFVLIENGKYSGMVTEGTKQVQISVEKSTGRLDEAGVPFREESIPEKYNQASILTADVPSAAATFDFDLKI